MTEHAKTSVVQNKLFQNPIESRHIEMDKVEVETIFPVKYICYKCKTVYYKRTQIERHLKLSHCEEKSIVTDKVVHTIKKLPGLSKNESYIKYKYHKCELC